MRLKYLLRHVDERLVAPETQLLSVSKTHGVVPRAEVSDTPGRAEDISNYKTCKIDDLVINRMSAYQGALGIARQFGAISPDYMVLRMTKGIRPGFAGYLFKSHFMISEMSSRVKGIGSVDSGSVRTPRLNWSDLGQVEVDLPPTHKQDAIADFLDRETAKIDALIAKQEQLIVTAAERRQALISKAVTKGLDPTVPLKSSGNHWLGDIPEHWELKPLARIASLNPESLGENTDGDLEIEYVEISDVNRESGVSNSTTYRFADAPSRARRLVKDGDVLVSTVRTYLRAIGKISELDGEHVLVASTGFAVLRSENVDPDFLVLALMAEHFVARVEAESVGVSYPGINASTLLRFQLPVPPLREQIEISSHLIARLQKLDDLTEKAKKTVSVLGERRQALISAAVTGKLEVGV